MVPSSLHDLRELQEGPDEEDEHANQGNDNANESHHRNQRRVDEPVGVEMDKVSADHRNGKVQEGIADGKTVDQRNVKLQRSEEKQVDHLERGDNEVIEHREGRLQRE